MCDRLLNNRKEWNAMKEIHEGKLAEIEAEKKAKEDAVEAKKGETAGGARETQSSQWSRCGWTRANTAGVITAGVITVARGYSAVQ